MTQPSIAIVVVTYNSESQLPQLAESLRSVRYPNLSLFFVDNASSDASAALLPTLFPAADIILSRTNLGFAHGVNQGLSRALAANPDYVLLLNPDATLEPDSLTRMVTRADASTLVVPAVWSSRNGRFTNQPGGFDWRGLHVALKPGAEIEIASFACILIPTTVFRAIGPLDEDLGMYYEDTDYCLRARKAGFRIIEEHEAVVHHWGGASSGGWLSPFTQYYATRNRAYLMHRHSSLPRYLAFSVWYLGTRLQRLVVNLKHGDHAMVRSNLLALRDLYTGRMGMTYQPSDLNDGRPHPGDPEAG
jgi:hypothetical protein